MSAKLSIITVAVLTSLGIGYKVAYSQPSVTDMELMCVDLAKHVAECNGLNLSDGSSQADKSASDITQWVLYQCAPTGNARMIKALTDMSCNDLAKAKLSF